MAKRRQSKRTTEQTTPSSQSPTVGAATSPLIQDKRSPTVWLQGGVLIAVAIWIYYSILNGSWLWDDDKYITRNPLIHDPTGFWKVWIMPDGLGNYYPLTAAVRWLQWQAWGIDSLGYHLTNLGLHLVSAFLLWRLFHRLGMAQAWIGALVFVVHPLMVESVAWVAELKNTLSLPPLLLAYLALLDFIAKGNRRGAYFLALAWFIVSLLAKTSGMLLPVIFLGGLWCLRGKITWGDIKGSFPFFALALAAGLVTVWPHVDPNAVPLEVVATGGWDARLASIGWALLFLLGKILLPVDLVPAYPSLAVPIPGIGDIFPWVLMGGFGLLFWSQRKSWGLPLLAGFGFFFLNLIPVVGFIAMHYATMVWSLDHLVYLPMIGLIGLFAVGVEVVRERCAPASQSIVTGGLTLILALLAFLAHGYAVAFSDEETLWNYAAERHPQLLLAQENLGKALLINNRPEEAKIHFEEVLKLQPRRAQAHFSLGEALVGMGKLDEGMKEYAVSLSIDPTNAEVENNFGVALIQQEKVSAAIEHFKEAIRLRPTYAVAYGNLGGALAHDGRFEDAVVNLNRSLELAPEANENRLNLAIALKKLGRIQEAIVEFKRVLDADPNNAKAKKYLKELQVDPIASPATP